MKTPRSTAPPLVARRRILATVLVLATATVPVVFADSCVQATIDERVVLPDGSMHGPGIMRICSALPMSPVAVLNTISIGGRTFGKFIGRRTPSEAVPEGFDAVLVFERIAGPALRLVGFGLRDRDRFAVTSFGPSAESLDAAVRRKERPNEASLAAAQPPREILVTASVP